VPLPGMARVAVGILAAGWLTEARPCLASLVAASRCPAVGATFLNSRADSCLARVWLLPVVSIAAAGAHGSARYAALGTCGAVGWVCGGGGSVGGARWGVERGSRLLLRQVAWLSPRVPWRGTPS
jgi:hypothetical protein